MKIIRECEINDSPTRKRKGFIISCECGKIRKIRADKIEFYNDWRCVSCNSSNLSKSKIYNSYKALKQRCEYEGHRQYKDYGGRGIKNRWTSFIEFYEHMFSTWFEGASIDRIDVNGDYCKENCRWATKKQQVRNARSSKHTVEQAELIRHLYATKQFNQNQLAKMFNDSQGNISNIILNRSWT